jgi:hypothetical protein
MGCGGSKQGDSLPSSQQSEIPAIDISSLDRYNKFEHTLPFYRTRIDVFEGRVKRFVSGKSSVSIAQLKYAFKDDQKWKDLQSENSILTNILLSDVFADEENKGEINI